MAPPGNKKIGRSGVVRADGYMEQTLPGPARGRRLPAVLPAGQFPPEESNMWLFTQMSIQRGQDWIQDDTREWFQDQDCKVEIRRDYPTHPRWEVDLNQNGVPPARTMQHNSKIVSEVHMLARVHAGMPDFPHWVPARMTVKQVQADLAFRFIDASRKTWISHGAEAITSMADRAPAQFVKFIAATFIPKKIETEVEHKHGIDKDGADKLAEAVLQELERRADAARYERDVPLDFEGEAKPIEDYRTDLEEQGRAFEKANHPVRHAHWNPNAELTNDLPRMATEPLVDLVNIGVLDAEIVEDETQTEEVEWD